jgi:hypothetical protein
VTHPHSSAVADVFLSVVLVVRNEEKLILQRLTALSAQLCEMVSDHEIIVVDNASTDETVRILEQATATEGLPNLQCFVLTKRVDFDTACWAGVVSALGDFVAVLESEMTHHAAVREMLAQAVDGSEVVLLRNTGRTQTSNVYGFCRACFLTVCRGLAGVDLTNDAPRTRLLSRRVVTYLQQFQVPTVMYRSLAATAGFKKTTLSSSVPIENDTDGSLLAAADRGIQLLVTSSSAPMRLANLLAFFGALANVIYSAYVITVAFTRDDVAPGWVTLSLQQSGMFFLISLVLFVLGEYVLNLPALGGANPRWHVSREFMSASIQRKSRLNVEEGSPPLLQRSREVCEPHA